MRCQELLATLNEFVDGEIRSALCREFQEHLAECKTCRIVIDNIRHTIGLFRAGRAPSLPPGLHHQILLEIRERWTVRPTKTIGLSRLHPMNQTFDEENFP
jgi:hypothetical protein